MISPNPSGIQQKTRGAANPLTDRSAMIAEVQPWMRLIDAGLWGTYHVMQRKRLNLEFREVRLEVGLTD